MLHFEAEYPLNREPLKIDVVIIKKEKGAVLDKKIAVVFRDVNILEFKSPDDSLGITDFHKVAAYAHLYCATVKDAGIQNMSISFIGRKRPEKLFRYLREIYRYTVEEKWPGIYEVSGAIPSMQIIESKRLVEEENMWLKNMSREVSTASLRKILEESSGIRTQTPIGAYLGVLLQANPVPMMEVIKMEDGTLTIEDVLEKTGWAAKFEARGEARGEIMGKREAAKNLIENGFAPEQAAKFSGLDIEAVQELYRRIKG
ncbi:MAG: hypothetical protein LBQ46_01410 [Treponema sp.]|jgi:hypothetical protein|nr:hypothetical protein [Treponema sp.]